MHKRFRIVKGDCFRHFRRIAPGSIDLVLADPPYGTTDLPWDKRFDLEMLWAELGRVLKPTGAVLLFASQPFTTELIASNRAWFRFCWYWQKSLPSGYANAKKRPLKVIEEVCVFSPAPPPYHPRGLQQLARPRPTSNKKPGAVGARSFRDDYCQTVTGYPRNLLAFKSVHRPRHPTQKPLDLVEYLVETHSRPGDLVLDFSMGSGTTGVASLKCDRRFIGIEQDESYFEIACDRIRQA